MMILGSRTTLERQAIRQLIAGMGETFPALAPSWLVAVEQTTNWHDLGQRIAETLQTQLAPPPQPEPVLTFLPPPPPPPNEGAWVKQVQQLQSALAQAQTRAASAEREAMRWQHEYVQAQQRAQAQLAQREDELHHLRRIVAEQQLQLHPPTASINPVHKSEGQ